MASDATWADLSSSALAAVLDESALADDERAVVASAEAGADGWMNFTPGWTTPAEALSFAAGLTAVVGMDNDDDNDDSDGPGNSVLEFTLFSGCSKKRGRDK